MVRSEAGYPDDGQIRAETSDKKVDNSDSGTQNMVHSATDFLAKFDGEETNSNVVNACIQEIQADTQLQTGFENLLKSGISDDIIDKIKQELQDGVEFGLDEITLKDSIRLIIKDAINGGFRVYSVTTLEGLVNQKTENEEKADQNEEKANQNEEKADQNEEKADQNEEKADQNEEKADQNEEKAKQKTEKKNQDVEQAQKDIEKSKQIMEEAKQYNDYLLNKYPELALRVDKNLQVVKQQLEDKGVLNQLRQTHDEQFINDYILAQTTLVELRKPNSNYEQGDISFFDNLVKKLDNACNIPDTSLSSFSSKNVAQTRTELFNDDPGIGNESLKTARDNNMDSHKGEYEKMFEMGDEDMIKKYGNLLEGSLKAFWEQYQNNYEIKNKFVKFKNNSNLVDGDKNILPYEKIGNNSNLADDDKRLLKNYDIMRSAIIKIREEVETETKNLMEEMCIISQIKGMYMCMGEGDDFNLNKAKEIESKDGVLTLRGHINGVDFAIRQDTNDPNAKLETSQKLARSADGKIFSMGGQDNFVASNFILPSQNEIFESIVATVQSDKSLEDSDNQDDYLKNLQKNIMGNMEEIYKDTEYVHHYMQGQVSGESIINGTMQLIKEKNPSIINNEKLLKDISENTNKDLFDFIKILKFNIDNSTNIEKDHLNQCITKILEITNNYASNKGTESYPPVIENYLKNKNWLNGGDENSRLSLISNLFKYYSEKSEDSRSNSEGTGNTGISSKMIINDLYMDLCESNNGKILSKTAGEYNEAKMAEENAKKREENDKTTEEEHNSADEYLVLAINNLPPSPEGLVNMA